MSQALSIETPRLRFSLLSNPTAFLCLVGIVLPNALFLGALIAGIGMPPRPAMIVGYATLAIVARIARPAVTIPLFLIAVCYDAVSTIALQFNLAPSEFGLALHLGGELNLFKSPLYMVMIGASLAFVSANLVLLTWKRALLQRGNPLVMMGLALAVAGADFYANTSPHYHYGTLFGAGKPVESAMAGSGLRAAALARKDRHVLVIMVEALGEFADPAHRALLMQPWNGAALAERYEIASGSTTYYGSTTAAEMRELCLSREPYQALIDGAKLDCLPAELSARGYRTVSLHNFAARFFDREHWYPKLGFERRLFREDLKGVPYKNCGGPFRGPCDADMIPVIAKELREAKEPTFFYWLTLSTHVPIAPKEGTPRLSCEQGGGKIGQAEVCYMTEMWIDLFEALARMTAELPAMEILIVGDHAPPLWSKTGRHLFEAGKVPWIRLTPKEARTSAVR